MINQGVWPQELIKRFDSNEHRISTAVGRDLTRIFVREYLPVLSRRFDIDLDQLERVKKPQERVYL
jgi:hypothetical protein